MNQKKFERKTKEMMPVLAICYDFDKTLTPNDMQAQGYIQAIGYDTSDFWKESNGIAANNDMDQNLAYMFKMLQEAEGNFVFNKQTLYEYGKKVKLFPGVEGWFERIRAYGRSKGVIVEHYIISSGLKEMIEGTSVARAGAFERIYASSYYYNDRGVAIWPAQVVNYTNKTQFLFRIEKGVLDVNDPGINDHFQPNEIRVPFRNMIYIGDSDTDIPCMKLVNDNGGYSIGVYSHSTKDKTKVYKMMRDRRINYFAEANYSENTELDNLVKKIIDRTAANESLEEIHFGNYKEYLNADKATGEEKQQKTDLIISLENSTSFASTHTIIGELDRFNDWSIPEKEALFEIAINNRQVNLILNDADIKKFYKRLLSKEMLAKESVIKVCAMFEKD
ncbi:MAG: haloacid dehalogenase-like hydrolase [Erysipelotrichaceae bacterium]|nr:haloacid dehalogenase-like hydrolase [Erysipelotrichaceae bacterium]